MTSRTRMAFVGEPPMWCVVSAHPDRVVLSAHRELRTAYFVGAQMPVAGVLCDVAGLMAVLGVDRLPAVLPWDAAVAAWGRVRLDPAVLRFGWRLRPHQSRRGLAARWAKACAEA